MPQASDDGVSWEAVSHSAGDVVAGRYRLVARIGAGGMGAVYKAEDTRSGRFVAVKILSPEHLERADSVARFEQEARAARLLESPHTVRVHDVLRLEDGTPMLVMELLLGNDLHQESARREIRVGELATWIGGVCSAIGEAHARGILHRDLKPANIFLAENDGGPRIVKVLDFGLSKFRDEERRLTIDGHTIGTFQYMSPEQLRGRPLDPKVDVYALGVVMYRLLMKRYPFDAKHAIAYATGTRTLPDTLFDSRPDVPPAVAAVVTRALSREPTARPTIEELAAALLPFATTESRHERATFTNELLASDHSGPTAVVEPSITQDRAEAPSDEMSTQQHALADDSVTNLRVAPVPSEPSVPTAVRVVADGDDEIITNDLLKRPNTAPLAWEPKPLPASLPAPIPVVTLPSTTPSRPRSTLVLVAIAMLVVLAVGAAVWFARAR